jgi:hypothetical protein
MEARVARLEEDMRDVKAILGRLEPMLIRVDEKLTATLPTLATKAELADKPGKAYLWTIMGVLIATVIASAALLK